MDGSDWLRLMDSSEALARLYTRPPDLASFDLFSVHIDERDTSLTLGFALDSLPERPPREWTEKGLNAFEFFLTFEGISHLRIDGWYGSRADSVTLTTGAPGEIRTEIRGDGFSASWDARRARVLRIRAYLAARHE
ncbi:Imm50 family immunity protein [Actinacidiphila paucisporea]|uniref:Immunity protein 50 n=1 Tax=Actinacidiphila paucisporea TaxID=310782 RepID=A0A1M7N290_9ACTN|nr:Imm50 family immunity protein [Actinacidiphila paucisporea]SHM97452.1 Immunity protein 50 [Actinacidiphila paucisporea]